MSAIGVRKHVIMANFIGRFGGYGKVGFMSKDLYNMCSREKRKLLVDGDATTAIAMLEMRKKKYPDFFFEHEVDSKGNLRNLFWCDGQSRQDYQDYGDVVVFDSTYKMNRYGMPFVPFVGVNNHRKTVVFGCAILSDETERTYVWLLNTFKKAMFQKNPRSIITDSDSAMIRAVRKVFPDEWYRICSWHIEKNMAKHLSFKSLPEFRSLLYYMTSTETFEQRWHAFGLKWKNNKNKTWLKRMYKKRRLWAAAYLKEGYWLGMKSNQRSESLNSCLHLHLDYGMTLVHLILHYENAIVRLRETEARDDCTTSQSLPVAVTESWIIEKSAAKVFTPANFYILQEELNKIGGLEIMNIYVDADGARQFAVVWKKKRQHRFYVDYRPASSDHTIECSCKRMIRRGLPCKHILHVLHYLDLEEIPSCLVLRRFSKNARSGLPARRTSDLYGWSFSDPEDQRKFTELNVLSAEALQVAWSDPVLYEQLKASFNDIISKRQAYATAPDVSRRFVNTDATIVGDPEEVPRKGARKNKRKRDGDDGPVSRNGRPLAYHERPKKRIRCGSCQQLGHTSHSIKCPYHPK